MASNTERIKGWSKSIKQQFSREGKDRARDEKKNASSSSLVPSPAIQAVQAYASSPAPFVNRPADVPLYSPLSDNVVQLDPNWINIGTLREWLWFCDNKHGTRCTQSRITAGFPRYLVDVNKYCLVKAVPGDRYAALSYVWGQEPGILSGVHDSIIVPRTIRDTIQLVRLLGMNLLWVDSLCLVQDDTESKHAQLNEMASIYSCAYVTVIAANGWDANHGLRGIKGVTESRMLSLNGDQTIIESLQPYSTIWYSRGWTFQELIFSPRKIMFQYQMAMWECACGVWHEATPMFEYDTASSSAPSDLLEFDTGFLPDFVSCTPVEIKPNFHWPDLHQYMDLVINYNDRHLTFPEDIIPGFSGVLATLGNVFTGGFVCGLPEMFFDDALLWQPQSPLERRVPTSKNSTSQIPSWSWAGWRGTIDVNSWASGYIQWTEHNYMNSSLRIETRPICQWSCGDGTKWRKLEIAHHVHIKERQQYITGKKAVPPGWTLSLDWNNHYYFFHHSMPAERFYYPIKLGFSEIPAPNDSSHLLSFRTSRIFLRFGPAVTTYSFDGVYRYRGYCSHQKLITEQEDECGFIRMNMSPSYVDKSKDVLIGAPCELIAIFEGSIPKKTYSAEQLDAILQTNIYPVAVDVPMHFYNVLWIEWVDGISYRKALGQVNKVVWDSQPTEMIDVILG